MWFWCHQKGIQNFSNSSTFTHCWWYFYVIKHCICVQNAAVNNCVENGQDSATENMYNESINELDEIHGDIQDGTHEKIIA